MKSYENRMVAVCMLCTGFAMFDRFAIANLSPFVMAELGMTNAQLGQMMSAVALAWAFSGFFVSAFSDMGAGKKKLLAALVLLFSAFSFLTGLARGIAMLVAIRFALGLFGGPVFPIVQAFSLAQSQARRRGLNMGLVTTVAMGLIANLIGPIALVALCGAIGWRATFLTTLIPGIAVAALVLRVLKEPDMSKIEGTHANEGRPTFREAMHIFKNRNVRTSMVFGCFLVSWNIAMLTFAPAYLVSVRGVDPAAMSHIMAVFGAAAVMWGLLVPSLSDRLGRKPVAIAFTLLSIVSPLGMLLAPSPLAMGVCIFIGWSGSGVFAIHQAAILGESVDTKYASSAMASVQMTGEIGGGVIGVMAAGILADIYGLHTALIFAACCAAAASLIAFAYYETAPAILTKRA